MRAVVLSDDRIINYLNENFINTWVPNSELGRVPSLREPITKRRERESKTFDTTHALAQAIMEGWKKGSPVDCFVISPTFELMGRQPVNELLFAGGNTPRRYLTFLQESLAGKLPGFGEDTSEPPPVPDSEAFSELDAAVAEDLKVILTSEKPKREVLNIFRTPEPGYQDYTVVDIDTTVFKDGGTLTIDISVGHAEASGSFDLFHGDVELPTEGAPRNAIASAWGVPPGKSRRITHLFDRGQHFKLGATGDWHSEKGQVNAFLAEISVESGQEPEPSKASSTHSEQSAEDVMNAFVEAFKNLDAEVILSMLTEDARETFGDNFQDMPEDVRTQMRQMLRQMEVLNSEYVGDEFHFRLRVPGAPQPEVSVKMRKVEGIWFIYDIE